MSAILIVDDDTRLRNSFERILKDEGYEVLTADSGEAGLDICRHGNLSLVVMDVRMPGMSGLETFREIRKLDTRVPVIIMTAYSTTETAIEATRMGAFDYVIKPFKIPEILDLIDQALESDRLMRSPVEMDSHTRDNVSEKIIGQSEAMQKVFKTIGRVADTNATVLIRGASGTGKELVARAIYQYSSRKDKPFVVINCVAIPESLLESELFGYEKGAFTGADRRKIGKIEQANGGTVFLDEIGDMPVAVQAKVLRLLQEKNIERLGGHETIEVDVRLVAATNRNLEEALTQGRFREDLYYRMRVVTVDLPPLCDRGDDINELTDYFLNRFACEMAIENPGISDQARAMLSAHSWPGNVRELANTLQKALIFCRGYRIRPDELAQSIESNAKDGEIRDDVRDTLRRLVREILVARPHPEMLSYLKGVVVEVAVEEALRITHGNRTQAAALLGVTRPTLHAKMGQYGLYEQHRDSDS